MKKQPPCKISFGANEFGNGYIVYEFEETPAIKVFPFHGTFPRPEDVREVWAVMNDPKEPGPANLTLVNYES
jgi:hypothetical protein